MNEKDFSDEKIARMAVRACRCAFRMIDSFRDSTRYEMARIIQEVWEDEGADLSSLANWQQHDSQADYDMRYIYRQRKGLPREIKCTYCGGYNEESKALNGQFCNERCLAMNTEYETRQAQRRQNGG